jgi:hypothetical protein
VANPSSQFLERDIGHLRRKEVNGRMNAFPAVENRPVQGTPQIPNAAADVEVYVNLLSHQPGTADRQTVGVEQRPRAKRCEDQRPPVEAGHLDYERKPVRERRLERVHPDDADRL